MMSATKFFAFAAICCVALTGVSCKMLTDLTPKDTANTTEAARPAPAAPAPSETAQAPVATGTWPERTRIDLDRPAAPPAGAPPSGVISGTAEAGRGAAGGVQNPAPAPAPKPEDELLKLIKSSADTPQLKDLVQAMLQALANHPDKAIAMLKQAESGIPADKKMLCQLLETYVNVKLGNMDAALKSVDQMYHDLRAQMPLTIASPKLCSKVESFGKYDEYLNYVFAPREKAILYYEPQYFICKPVDKEYVISLNAKYAITDKDGNQVWHAERTVEHKTSHNLYDLFLTQMIVLPQLATGKYNLKISLQDMNKPDMDKPVETTIAFEVRTTR